MEYLEGEPLADRLQRGPLPLDEALTCAIEIAGALDQAHRAGFVHRDLKPGNIMLTKAGAKLLDFGLAKWRPMHQGTVAGMTGRATQQPLTEEGRLVGTLAYMAPEQLEGKDVDHRADIWAFGCVVYEMVTGKKAFDGASPASVIGAILHREPLPLRAVQPVAPRLLDHVVEKCLTKDPDGRWQTARDLTDALKWLAEDRSSVADTADGQRFLMMTAPKQENIDSRFNIVLNWRTDVERALALPR
jgi:serine/threonine-protein kinase